MTADAGGAILHPDVVERDAILAAIYSLRPTKEELLTETAAVIQGAIQYVLDGEEHLDDLEGCEKTQLGTKVEKRWLRHFRLPMKKTTAAVLRLLERTGKTYQNPLLDTFIAGLDVDIKHTVGSKWMIPLEAIGRWCLLFSVNYEKQTYDLGLLKMHPEFLTTGRNRDSKVSVNKDGRKAIHWIVQKHALPVVSQ